MVKRHKRQEFLSLFHRWSTGNIKVAGKNQQILKDRQVRIQVVFLLTDTDPGFNGTHMVPDIQSKNRQMTGRHGGKPINHPDGCRFSSPVWPEDAIAFPGPDMK